jgi:4-aminobutyrate aminotransferase-like enzyme/Ser/Thr protein kinase RdoA (MazF antagonist)
VVTPEDSAVPPISVDEARRLAARFWGLDRAAHALPGEYDSNFHLLADDGPGHVLKVMHPARDRGLVDLQRAALQHVAGLAPDLPLPRVVPALSGAPIVELEVAPGDRRLAWVLTYVAGRPLAETRPHLPEMMEGLGRFLGRLDAALASFAHPFAQRELKWDLARAGWIRGHLGRLADPGRRALVERALALFDAEVAPVLAGLRRSVIHGDANDWNVLLAGPPGRLPEVVAVIDLGDMHLGLTVAEPAVAAAYAILGKDDPLPTAAHLVAGYHGAHPLQEAELALVHPLVAARLATSVVNSALRAAERPDDPYVTISERPAWAALERWLAIDSRRAHLAFRAACGLPPVPDGAAVARWLASAPAVSVLDADLRSAPSLVFDLSVGSLLLGADPGGLGVEALSATIEGELARAGVAVGVGRYDEVRALYTSPLFEGGSEARTVHLGIDLFVPAGSIVRAPLDGVVERVANNTAPLDYGPLVILRHATDLGRPVFTLYGHLADDVLGGLTVGQPVRAGQAIARVGAPPGNGGWPPHLHFQVILDLLGLGADFPGVARVSERALWTALSPDPNLLLRIPAGRFPAPEPSLEATLAARRERLGRNLSISYRRPLKIVRGFLQHLFDDAGRRCLDVYNNVPLVGHGHPRVVGAAQAQLALLNTNTRYLHEGVVRYAGRLGELLPAPLQVCFFVSSGSEANELALRLARAHTGSRDVIVLEHAYHGHTTTLIDVSPYKFLGPGGSGRRDWVHVAPLPDDYRGPHRRDDPEAGPRYARHVGELAARAVRPTFLAETLPSVAGQIVLPPGYLAEAYRYVRAAGGVCIADEVQTGFGRLGSQFWGFVGQGVVPDIVVLGKPIGNGFPLGAVITTPEIAASFDNGMEFFATFGGNPVACAAGLAVLDVLRDEGLQENARQVGERLMAGLRRLQDRHPLIGDVRGSGLYLGVDLVRDRETREPAGAQADYVVNRLRERGILTGTDGPGHNVLKLRPPLCFRPGDADLFVSTLDDVLAEDAAQAG